MLFPKLGHPEGLGMSWTVVCDKSNLSRDPHELERLIINVTAQKKYTITIVVSYDKEPENPRNRKENFMELICFCLPHSLGDPHNYSSSEEFEQWLKSPEAKDYFVVPLFVDDHLGFYTFYIPLLGAHPSEKFAWARVDLRRVAREFFPDHSYEEMLNVPYYTYKLHSKAKDIIELELEVYHCYLSGNVYCFSMKVEEVENDEKRILHQIDKICGLYGLDDLSIEVLDCLSEILWDLPLTDLERSKICEDVCAESFSIKRY
ncbi:MAG: hypothetical protein KatS3mg087_0012 [Patescibacteria group bacterium]|nr:MAG: hypothetical protein KatS3mg087_0012 [Patescibacteria group bacterium]